MKLKMVRLFFPTLHSLTLASGLSPTPNRCIFDFVNTSSKFLAPLGTSDMSRTLSAIANFSGKIGKILAKEGKDDKEKVGEIS